MTRERGFTLVEVLIAFAIVALALVAVHQAFAMALDVSRRSTSVTRAALVAESVLEELEVRFRSTGNIAARGVLAGCDWTTDSRPFPLPSQLDWLDPGIAARYVQVTVSVGCRGRDRGDLEVTRILIANGIGNS